MKEINLVSLIEAKRSLETPVYEKYLEYFKATSSDSEVRDLEVLVKELLSIENEISILNNYFLGYTIPQISKEFDLLRFGKNYIINIELKRISTKDEIKKQLLRNKYYLSFLDKKTYSYTFVSSSKKLYFIDKNKDLIERDITDLFEKIDLQEVEKIPNIDNLFNPSNYLISPFNSTKKFIQNKYFLTGQQELTKKRAIDSISNNKASFISIYGRAGTGKTLLTYDIAKECIKQSLKVLIIHCGKLNIGQNTLVQSYKWNIIPVKLLNSHSLSDYSLVIVDETQRIYPRQLDSIIEQIKNNNGSCVFSYDNKQCLKKSEIRNNIEQRILEKTSPIKFELTKKIRTNKEVASFILSLFNKSRNIERINRSNIELNYFINSNTAKKFINLLTEEGWKIINYTPSQYDNDKYEEYAIPNAESTHDIIGQEFDKVIAVIDSKFYYKGNELSYRSSSFYDAKQMLFQVMTRTRKKLNIVIINNEEIMDRCLTILSVN